MRVFKKSHAAVLCQVGLFVLAVVLTELALDQYYQTLLVSSAGQRTVEEQLAFGRHYYDVLFLGDSTAAAGVDAELFQSITGKTSFTASTHRFIAAYADVSFVRSYLRSHPPPKAVFVMRSIEMWSTAQDKPMLELHEQDPCALDASREWFPMPLEKISKTFLTRLFPSLRIMQHRTYVDYVRCQTVIPPPTGPFVVPAYPASILIREENRSQLQLLCDTADEYRVPTFISVSPNAFPNSRDVEKVIASLIDSTSSDYCAYLPLPRVSLFHLSDAEHLNASGAVITTQFLAKEFLERITLVEE